MKEKFKVGDKVRIIANTHEHFFKIGEIVIIVKCNETDYKAEYLDGHDYWLVNQNDVEPLESDQITINRYGNKVVAKMGKKVGVARCNETDTFDLYTGTRIAVDRLFGKESEAKEVKEVKREAGVGDWIKIVNASGCPFDEHKNGDVLKVVKRDNYRFSDGRAFYKNERNKYASLNEYVVLENYKPQEKPQEEKPKYYNGKTVCVRSDGNFSLFTVGKIYEFKDGVTKMDCEIISARYKSINQFNKVNKDYELIELVE